MGKGDVLHPRNLTKYDLVFVGGRVIDPESKLDKVLNVGIVSGQIGAVTSECIHGRETIDARGLVVAPGFIDMHSHGLGLAEQRLQALDGVTTSLELECGSPSINAAYAKAGLEGRVLNYGFSASWAGVRMQVMANFPKDTSSGDVLASLGSTEWRRTGNGPEVRKVLEVLEEQLVDGGIGVGILLGYSPYTDPGELVRVSRLAAQLDVPTYTHARPLIEQDPDVTIDGAQEIAELAASTGAHMHYCHINSTSNQYLDRVWAVLEIARAEGARVTAEAYPYGSGMTVVGADSLAPEKLSAFELEVSDLIYSRTGKHIASILELERLRRVDPGGLVFEQYFDDDAAGADRVASIISRADWAVVSDAMPLVWNGPKDPSMWPLPDYAITHPRSAGTFGRALRLVLRGPQRLSLLEMVGKFTLQPARIIESAAPMMRRKGRVQVGCDADLTVFDPALVTDMATYVNTTIPSRGFEFVLVNGVFVVKNGELQLDVRPGQAIRNRL